MNQPEYNNLNQCIDKLSEDFSRIVWEYLDVPAGDPRERTQLWPGSSDEDIMICVYKGRQLFELFHRQDFFFFNFAYEGDYSALSYISNNTIVIEEGGCYIGQPYAGYAIHDRSEQEKIIVGVLIQKEAFFRTFFHILSGNKELFQFFLTPQTNEFSAEYIHLKFQKDFSVRHLLDIMIMEYANKNHDSQSILQSLTLSLMMFVAREYKTTHAEEKDLTLSDQIVSYIEEHYDHVTLSELSDVFSYHPNYISSLLSKEYGKTFSQLLLEQRMERAVSLMQGTDLSIQEISIMLGYSNHSNFYKAFREYYHQSPREFMRKDK